MFDILNKIGSTSKRKEKEQILLECSNDPTKLEMLKTIVKYAYSESLTYNVIKYNKAIEHAEEATLSDALALLDKLNDGVYTGDNAISMVEMMYKQLSSDDAEVFDRIISRDLKCGCGIKTFNKCLGECVYIAPYRRCKSFSKKNLEKIKLPALSQVKMDGAYNSLIVNNSVKIEARSGLETKYKFNEHINSVIEKHANGKVLMGEALVWDPKSCKYLKREDGNGYLNSDDIDMSLVKIVLWDVVPVSEYNTETKSSKGDLDRFNDLSEIVGKINNELGDSSPFRVVECRIVNNVQEIIDHFRECIERGEEGTVIKNFDGLWYHGDCPDCVKIKILFEVDLRLNKIMEGTGRNTDRAGSLEFSTSDNKLVVGVGIGYSDDMREELWTMKELYEGNNVIATIRANDIMNGDSDIMSLFLPRFIELRPDKSEADDLDRVIEQRNAVYDIIKMIFS